MSALTVLYLILPFPLAFILHEIEEICTQRKWMDRNAGQLEQDYPSLRRLITNLSGLSTLGFSLAALEELLLILVAVCCVLVDATYSVHIWGAVFIAFSVHTLVHIAQAIVIRKYVPGLVTSVLLLPYCFMGIKSLWLYLGPGVFVLLGVGGTLIMVLNLFVLHSLCRKLKH